MKAFALWLLLVGVASAAVLDGRTVTQGTLVTAQTGTGVSVNSVLVGRSKNRSMVFTFWNTAGTATVQLEINCTGAPAGWALVAGSSSALTVSGAALSVVYPLCEYRANVTACSTCSVNGHYYIGPEIQ